MYGRVNNRILFCFFCARLHDVVKQLNCKQYEIWYEGESEERVSDTLEPIGYWHTSVVCFALIWNALITFVQWCRHAFPVLIWNCVGWLNLEQKFCANQLIWQLGKNYDLDWLQFCCFQCKSCKYISNISFITIWSCGVFFLLTYFLLSHDNMERQLQWWLPEMCKHLDLWQFQTLLCLF